MEKGVVLILNMHTSGLAPLRFRRAGKRVWPVLAVLVLAALYLSTELAFLPLDSHRTQVHVPLHAAEALAKCQSLNLKPLTAPAPSFGSRSQSDRYEHGTKSVLIRNTSIWTGLQDGMDVVHGDILLEQGLIKAVGDVDSLVTLNKADVTEIDAKGAWVTPGIVDVHSHIAVEPSPSLKGANDGNSLKGLTLPWLRSLDGLNTHDASYAHSIAGGVTTSLILPGSADAIGGQAFAIKLRSTTERSPSSMLVDPPYSLNGTQVDPDTPPRWRHMKHACGENPSRVYSGTRMDTVWSYREAYEYARQIKNKQDEYCSKAIAGEWKGLGDFPEDLQWEALVDILRGKVKVQTHCYEAVDFDAFVRLSNEFRFPIAAFHHAHEAYLVPDVLKRAYEHPPAVAVFAAFSRYKREGYRHSEFAPRVLNDDGLKVVMKSDHPAIQSRWLLHEAQQAHYYGLPENVALASVTTNAAEVLGLEHRLGYITGGYDADLVIWDSHPLALGVTPVQVFIDGIPQLETSFSSKKDGSQAAPVTPNFDEEAKAAVKYVGLPPLEATPITFGGVVFRNVSSMWRRDEFGVHPVFQARSVADEGIVLVEKGEITCAGSMGSCDSYLSEGLHVVNLEGGSIAPALVSAGTAIGLQEIAMESSTSDGPVLDPLEGPIPILGEGSIIRAVDGLMFGTRDALLAYRSGVSTAVTSPIFDGLLGGLSTHFFLGAQHQLEKEAVLKDVTAVHVAVVHRSGGTSVSTQIAALRRLLLGPYTGERGTWFKAVVKGELPLVVNVKNADIIATLLKLKHEVEAVSGTLMKMTLVGAAEAHLVAAELAGASVGVVTPPRSFPFTWEGRRILHGPPVTEQSLITTLFAHGVTVGIGHQGVEEEPQMAGWAARNLRWDAAWASIDSQGLISMVDALTMATTNVEKLLGVTRKAFNSDMVATKGGELLSFEGKVVAVTSPRRGVVDLF
ncbi:carbohydrate esterase family 9 protein [Gyrodon lividus]|nr:carbohydrate esterase family 9 protein [Gyrodon lividus]